MAEEVIKKVNRDDWAIRMGLILDEDSPLRKVQGEYRLKPWYLRFLR